MNKDDDVKNNNNHEDNEKGENEGHDRKFLANAERLQCNRNSQAGKHEIGTGKWLKPMVNEVS